MSLDPVIEAGRTATVYAPFWLIELRFPVVQRLTDFDQPIVYGGQTFAPAPLTVDGVASDASGVATGSGGLTIGSGDDYWPTLLAALSADEMHPEVALYEAWLEVATMSPTPAAVRHFRTFRLEAWEVVPLEARLTLGPAADATLGRLPFREYGGGLCTFRLFKGPQCAYAGAATSCDRTYATCTALGNAARFGGFLALPGEEVTLTWVWQSSSGQLFEETLTLTRRAE